MTGILPLERIQTVAIVQCYVSLVFFTFMHHRTIVEYESIASWVMPVATLEAETSKFLKEDQFDQNSGLGPFFFTYGCLCFFFYCHWYAICAVYIGTLFNVSPMFFMLSFSSYFMLCFGELQKRFGPGNGDIFTTTISISNTLTLYDVTETIVGK